MINQDGYLTAENKYLKDFLLANYDTTNTSVAYGRINIVEGFFTLAKRDNDGKYAFFLNFNGVNSCEVFDTLTDEKLKECLNKTGLPLLEAKPEPVKEEKTYTNLFDFL